MISWQLLKCVFGMHEYSTEIYDDILNKWVRICTVCGKHIDTDAPMDDNGDEIDPHVWIRNYGQLVDIGPDEYEIGYDLAIGDDCNGD